MRGFATKKNRILKARKIESVLKDYFKKEVKNLKILDIGSGSGIIANYFSKDNDVFCVDIKDQRLNKRNSIFKKVSSEKLPFDDDFFDIAISNLVIEHMKNQDLHLKEIRRVLKDSGICYLAAPNKLFPIEPHHKTPLIHWLPNSYFLGLLKLIGKYKEDIFLPSYFELVAKIKKYFSYKEYTHLILRNPRKYFLKKLFLKRAFLKFPEKLNFLIPTNIFILKKRARKKKKAFICNYQKKMKKIIIMSSLGIGDIITSEPLLKKLKKVYPDVKIVIYSLKGGYLENLKILYVDEIIRLDNHINLLRFFKEKSDLLINLGYYSKVSGYLRTLFYYIITFLSGSRKKIFCGDLESFEFKNKNMVQIKLGILKKLNIKIKNSDYNLFLPFSFKKEKKKTNKMLRANKIDKGSLLTILHVGAKEGYFTRFWPSERWVEIINYLVKKYQAKIGFIGGKEDIKKTNEVIYSLKFPILNLVGKLSLQEATALINKSKLFISTNSGPMWLAAALRKPQIALCGPSKTAWAPYSKNARIIRKVINRKYCNPPCDAKTCYYKDNLCMKSIKIEEIIESIKRRSKYMRKKP